MLTINDSPLEPALARLRRWGELGPPVALGRSGSCWRVEAGGRARIVKLMPHSRPPEQLSAIWTVLGEELCPQLQDRVDADDGWWAIFEHVEGTAPSCLPQSFVDLLARLSSCAILGPVELVDEWLGRLINFRYRDAVAELLRRRLLDEHPDSASVLAHGDFAPQNMLETVAGLLLVDWEQCGRAPAAFDAGWLAALTRARLVPGSDPDALARRLRDIGIRADELRWFEGLGLLRLLYRVRTMTMPHDARQAAAGRVRAAMLFHLA